MFRILNRRELNGLKLLLCLLMSIPLLFLVSCVTIRLPEFENKYFKYAIKTPKTYPKYVYIIGLTDLGKQQKYLILPHEVDGMKVKGIGYGDHDWFKRNVKSYFESENLVRLYIDYETFVDEEWEEDYKVGSMANIPNCYVVYNGRTSKVSIELKKDSIWPYYPSSNNYTAISNSRMFANISFMFNYNYSPKRGIYWIDCYDNSLIEFIPPDPERDGYLFSGWYKEKECINEWDFATDKTKDIIIYTSENNSTYLGTSLYAKWIKD